MNKHKTIAPNTHGYTLAPNCFLGIKVDKKYNDERKL